MAKSGPLSAKNGPALGLNQIYVLKEAVICRFPASFVVEIGWCIVNEKGTRGTERMLSLFRQLNVAQEN